MVDFNNENTITTAPRDIIKIIILERRKYVIDALEEYFKHKAQGLAPNTPMLHGRLMALYYEIEPMLKRSLDAAEFEELGRQLESKAIDQYIKGFAVINFLMDKKGITKIDTRKEFDRTNVEAENEAFGL